MSRAIYRVWILHGLLTVMLIAAATFTYAQASSAVGEDRIFPATRSLYQPVDAQQRWNIYFRDNFLSPGAYFRALGSSIGERYPRNPKNWPSGGAGYFADVGSQFGRYSIEGTIEASMAAGLRYDPRYLACACQTPGQSHLKIGRTRVATYVRGWEA